MIREMKSEKASQLRFFMISSLLIDSMYGKLNSIDQLCFVLRKSTSNRQIWRHLQNLFLSVVNYKSLATTPRSFSIENSLCFEDFLSVRRLELQSYIINTWKVYFYLQMKICARGDIWKITEIITVNLRVNLFSNL